MSGQFHILTVCTGNICRSPLAQQLLELKLGYQETIVLSSAGTKALVDSPMDERSQEIALSLGVPNPQLHRARQLSSEILESADLIFAMSREHRKHIVELSPRVTKRVFTILDFARLADAVTDADLQAELSGHTDSAARLRAAVSAALLARSDLALISAPSKEKQENSEDIVDPYRQDDSVYQRSTSQLVPAVDSVVGLFTRVLGA